MVFSAEEKHSYRSYDAFLDDKNMPELCHNVHTDQEANTLAKKNVTLTVHEWFLQLNRVWIINS